MQQVTLTMEDLYTGKVINRTIDITNAMYQGSSSWVLGSHQSQESKLKEWIEDRGNAQHNTELELISWMVH
ncbi:MAG: hypothetical protein QM500_12285 [Methylococcales bacterium]